jgi:hypothetical protein
MSALQILVIAAWVVLAICVYLMGSAFFRGKRRAADVDLQDS